MSILRRSFTALCALLAFNSAFAVTVLDDDFLGSGGVPAGWTQTLGAGTITHTGSIVTMDSGPFGAPLIMTNSVVFDPQGQTTTIVAQIASNVGPGVGLGFGLSGGGFGITITVSETGAVQANANQFGGNICSIPLAPIGGYGGGPIDLTVVLDSAGFQVTSISYGYDSLPQSWTSCGGAFDLSSLGVAVNAIAFSAAPNAGPFFTHVAEFDRITITTEPVSGPTDSDGDGVPDSLDLCPGTAAGASVDVNGCSDAQLDDDGDLVSNDADLCPGTAAGAAVDANGCSAAQLDDDGDGVSNDVDLCANTSSSPVDANGCSQAQVDTDLDGVCDPGEISTLCTGSDNCPATANPLQFDDDYDDLGNACDSCPNDPGACPVGADVTFDKAEVKFNYGKVKIYGNLSVPPGYWSDNLNLTGSAQLLLAGTNVATDGVTFELKGDDFKKFEYETEDDDLIMGIKKLKVDFKGAKFDYKHDNGVELKTDFIGGEETIIEIKTDSDSWPTTIMIRDQIIEYDAAGNITTDVPYELYKEGETKKVFYTLPLQLLPGDSVMVDSDSVYVGDHYKEGTVKFKLEARFDETQPPFADAADKTLQLDLSLGGVLSAIGVIGDQEWDEIKDDKWKF